MATSALSSPITLTNGVILPNRLAKAAMAENMAPKSNLPDENFQRVYRTWADGGWGLVMTGNVQIDPAHLGGPGDLSVDHVRIKSGDAAYLKAWEAYADAATANGTVAIVQINHPGRQSPRGAGSRGLFAQAVAPSPVPLDFGSGLFAKVLRALAFGTPRELRTEEVDEIIAQFVGAGKLAYDSGFSGVEIHGAHGYLLGTLAIDNALHRLTLTQRNSCLLKRTSEVTLLVALQSNVWRLLFESSKAPAKLLHPNSLLG